MVEKKSALIPSAQRRLWVQESDCNISIARRCHLMNLSRSYFYYEPVKDSEENLELMKKIDRNYLEFPYYGSRKMTVLLRQEGIKINRKKVVRLMQLMGLETIYQKPKTSVGNRAHKKYPYLLEGMKIEASNEVWAADITYIPMSTGFMYLVAVIDWFSRYVLAWELSNTLDTEFCKNALESALKIHGRPKIFNTDQGSQFTSDEFTGVLKQNEVQISMDGKGRALDNVFIERLWRSLKYEDVYLKHYETVKELSVGINDYLSFFNERRIHQSLSYKTPAEVYKQPQHSRA